MRQQLEINGAELPTGRRRLLPGGNNETLMQAIDPNRPMRRSIEEEAPPKKRGELEADEERPGKRRKVARRFVPDEFKNYEGALIINGKPLERFTVAQVEAALISNGGFLSMAARSLACSPDVVRGYIKRYPKLQRLQDEFVEARLDVTERNLDVHCQLGSLEAIKFMLDRKGRGRGYGKEVDKGPKVVKITIVPSQPAPYMISDNSNAIDVEMVTNGNGNGSGSAAGDSSKGDSFSEGQAEEVGTAPA